mgnify:FL=1
MYIIARYLILSTASLIISMGVTLANEQAPNELTFGLYQSDKATEMHRKFKPIIDYLSQEVSRLSESPTELKLKIYKSYQGANDALVTGEVDFVRFGPASYILAKNKQPNIQLLAMEEKKGKTRFNGLIVVSKNSSIKTLSDLNGHSFAFGNINSTIGRYLAQSELIKVGVTSSSISKLAFLGRHDKVFKAVELGDYDAGSLKESTFKKMNKKGQLRVLHSFENITKPWIARAHLSPKIFKAVSTALIELSDPNILKQFKVSGFVAVNDSDYRYVREGIIKAKQF